MDDNEQEKGQCAKNSMDFPLVTYSASFDSFSDKSFSMAVKAAAILLITTLQVPLS